MNDDAVARLYGRWARDTFWRYRCCVGLLSVEENGQTGAGTCFHVGEGVFVTARHVVVNKRVDKVEFDDCWMPARVRLPDSGITVPSRIRQSTITSKFLFHPDCNCDIACFRADPHPAAWIPLGSHLTDLLSKHELVLHPTLIMGYPPIPLSKRSALLATRGEINALVDSYLKDKCRHPAFVVSAMARGGYSGGPALVAYDEGNLESGTAALGVVIESLNRDNKHTELGYMAVLTIESIYECLEHHDMVPKAQDIADYRRSLHGP
jgi:hypothetical protein